MGLDYGMIFIQADAIHTLKRKIRWSIYDKTFSRDAIPEG